MQSNSHVVGFSARIPRELVDQFNRVQEAYGARVWFVRTALHKFNREIESHPELIPQIKSEIALMLSTDLDSAEGTMPFMAQVGRDDYDEFNKHFPEYGATSWFIRSIVRAYIQEAQPYPTGRDLVYRAIDSIIVPPSEGATL